MKKVLAISSVLLGVVFLAGCGQQPVSQTQPTTPVPVAQTPTQPVATQPAPTTPAVTQNYVEVKELGFKIPVDASMENEIIYKIIDQSGVYFSSKALNAKNKECENGGGGSISKIMGTPTKPATGDPVFYKAHLSDIKQFDGFFLIFGTPQAPCHSGDNSLDRQIMQAVSNGLKNAVLIVQ